MDQEALPLIVQLQLQLLLDSNSNTTTNARHKVRTVMLDYITRMDNNNIIININIITVVDEEVVVASFEDEALLVEVVVEVEEEKAEDDAIGQKVLDVPLAILLLPLLPLLPAAEVAKFHSHFEVEEMEERHLAVVEEGRSTTLELLSVIAVDIMEDEEDVLDFTTIKNTNTDATHLRPLLLLPPVTVTAKSTTTRTTPLTTALY